MLGDFCIFLFTMKTVHLILFLSFITSVFLDQLWCFVYTRKTALVSFEEFSMLGWVHTVLVEVGGTAAGCCCVGGLWICKKSSLQHVSLEFVATDSVKGFAVLLRNVRIFITSEAPVWWVDKCLEGFPQTSNQQLRQIISEQSSARVSLDFAPISIFFKNSGEWSGE